MLVFNKQAKQNTWRRDGRPNNSKENPIYWKENPNNWKENRNN